MVKIYIGSSLSMALKVNDLAQELLEAGHTIVSTWHTETNLDKELTHVEKSAVALQDYTELMTADVYVDLTPFNGQQGGQAVEFGMSVAWGKIVILVGARDHIFHYLETIAYVERPKEVIEVLTEWDIVETWDEEEDAAKKVHYAY